MRRYLLVVSAVALLGACHKNTNDAAASDASAAAASDQMAQSSAAAAASSASDAAASATTTAANAPAMAASDFVTGAAASDMYEVQAAKIALQRSHNADVKMFAHMMIKDHTASTKALKAAIAASGRTDLAPPAALPADKQAMIDDLNKAAPADFDAAYMKQQTDAHEATLDLMNGYAAGGDVDAIKAFAGQTAPVVQTHLDKAKSIQGGLKTS